MTPETRGRFKSLCYILVAQGFNFWDARMKARQLLGIKVPYERRKRLRLVHSVGDSGYQHSPEKYPTDEDRLDTYFHAIIATCKSVVHGTAVIRNFSEYAQSWQEAPVGKKNGGRYRIPKDTREDVTKSLVDRMIRVLKSGGMTNADARRKAKELIMEQKENKYA